MPSTLSEDSDDLAQPFSQHFTSSSPDDSSSINDKATTESTTNGYYSGSASDIEE